MSKLQSSHVSWGRLMDPVRRRVYLTKKSSPETIPPHGFLTQNNQHVLGEPGNLVPKFPNLLHVLGREVKNC